MYRAWDFVFRKLEFNTIYYEYSNESPLGSPDSYLEVVDSIKILGLIIRSDMRWYDNTNYMCQKGYKRLWMLRRLKGLGASLEESKDVYIKQVRSVMELAVSVWQPALTNQEVKQIERG